MGRGVQTSKGSVTCKVEHENEGDDVEEDGSLK
jgi:hypothetical protein